MVQDVRTVRVFVASPADLETERKELVKEVQKINTVFASKGVAVRLLMWEKDAGPAFGPNPQAVINKQMGDYDVFLGILWTRFGTPTETAGSGTEEEFNRAYQKFVEDSSSVELMVYFKEEGPKLSELDLEQYAKVRSFRDSLTAKGGLYGAFVSGEEIVDDIRIRLTQRLVEEHDRGPGNQCGRRPSPPTPDGPDTTGASQRIVLPDLEPIVAKTAKDADRDGDVLKYVIIGLPQNEGTDFSLSMASLFGGELTNGPPVSLSQDAKVVEFTFASMAELVSAMSTVSELVQEATKNEGFSEAAFMRAVQRRVVTRLRRLVTDKSQVTEEVGPSGTYVILGVAKRAAVLFQAALLCERIGISESPVLSEDSVSVRFQSLADGQAWSDALQRIVASDGGKSTVIGIVAEAALGHMSDKLISSLEDPSDQ